MFLTEYDQEKVLEQERRDSERRGEKRGFNKGLNQGLDQGLNQGLNQAHEQTAKNMLRDGEPLLKIVKYSELAEDVVRALAKKIGVAIA